MKFFRPAEMTRTGRWTASFAVAAAATMALGACSSSKTTSAVKTTKPNPQASSTSATSSVGTMVAVDEADFTLKLSTTTFHPGIYTFTAKNTGQKPHALEIEGPGVTDAKTQVITNGGTTSITVTLKNGKYELYCPVGNHKAMGMKTDITVA